MLKLRARITMEAEITEEEAEILVNAAQDKNGDDIALQMKANDILKKAFQNAGDDSYIPGDWLMEEIAEELGMEDVVCDDLDVPEGDYTK